MKIEAIPPFTAPRGTYKTTNLVFSQYEGETVCRAKVVPANPQSVDQVKVRTYVTVASRFWNDLSEVQRLAWKDYSERHLVHLDRLRKSRSLGLRAFMSANSLRQILGLALVQDAPTLAPPMGPTAIRQLAGQNVDTVGIELDHANTDLTGLLVLVRATPAMVSTARRPRNTDYRYVRSVSPDSFLPLPATGGTVVFTPSRFTVEDGQRYGVEVQIVRSADGIASDSVFGDFIKSV